ncbi:MAG TPA: sensor histidine kinase [Mesorhizobium sp.]|nr:sensor histidine kinase [Mesorhizobium sp.]
MSSMALDRMYQSSARRAVEQATREQDRHRDALTVDLQESLAREGVLLREKHALSQRQVTLTQEFEHRLINSLQLIVSLLSLQSRTATTPEAAAQLLVAARRVGALGRVHRRLHLLDHEDNVRFKPYLQHLCADLSDLLLQDGSGYAIVVESENVEIPTAFAIPLGFIVNELVTNSAKYAQGNITVGFKATSSDNLSLTVSDDGPGLPTGFDASKCTGLGMKIVLALVKQVGGELHILPGDNGRGTRFAVTFGSRLSPA